MASKSRVTKGDEPKTPKRRGPKPGKGTSARTLRRSLPPEERRPRGRPAHKPTDEQRAKVRMLIGSGMPGGEVAVVLGISEITLAKHFTDELLHGRAKMRAEAFELVWKHARSGSSPMIRKVVEMTEVPRDREEFLRASTAAQQASSEPRAPKIGKKEALKQSADNPDQNDPLGALMAERMAAGDLN